MYKANTLDQFCLFHLWSSQIENSKNYLDDYIQTIIEENTGKKAKYGTPKGCTTGILEDSKELQAMNKTLSMRKPLDIV
jgi:hypothetical protein